VDLRLETIHLESSDPDLEIASIRLAFSSRPSHQCHDRAGQKETKMKSFRIDTDNNITAFAGSQESKAAGGESFRTEAECSKLTAGWPTRRLVEVWNGIPGFTPVNS
jgi:hypothetical protein